MITIKKSVSFQSHYWWSSTQNRHNAFTKISNDLANKIQSNCW